MTDAVLNGVPVCVLSCVCVCELTLTVVKDLKAIMMVVAEVHANNDVGEVADDSHERRDERLLEPHHAAWCVHAGRDMSSNDNLLKANSEGKLGYYPLLISLNLSRETSLSKLKILLNVSEVAHKLKLKKKKQTDGPTGEKERKQIKDRRQVHSDL